MREYGALVMFSHTVFSLSFAFVSLLLASDGALRPWVVFWALTAFLAARTGANAINRVIDREIDGLNPRTSERHIPSGKIKSGEVAAFAIICFGVMIFAAGQLNTLCLVLSPVALIFLVGYSYTKRFTWLCHFVLGVTTAIAPVGAWLAVTGKLSLLPLMLGAANTLWVSGFDIMYAVRDYEFDVANGVHSIPARFGITRALWIARAAHLGAWVMLLVIGTMSHMLGVIYFVGLVVVGILFIVQHSNKRGEGVYGVNQAISLTFLLFGLIDCFV